MKYLFYLIGIFPILWEMINIFDFEKVYNYKRKLRKIKDSDVLSSDQKLLLIFMLLYIVWMLIGLFTFNWILFLILFLSTLIPKKNKFLMLLDSVISLIILLFIILNAFHFNIDLWYLIAGK